MESLTDYIECVKCGSEAYQELNLDTGEESIMCPHCGYNRKFFITSTENVYQIPIFDIQESGGFGAYKVRHKDCIGHEIGSFTEPASEQEFIKLVEENKQNIDHAEYTTFIEGHLTNIVLILGDIESHGEEIPAHIE